MRFHSTIHMTPQDLFLEAFILPSQNHSQQLLMQPSVKMVENQVRLVSLSQKSFACHNVQQLAQVYVQTLSMETKKLTLNVLCGQEYAALKKQVTQRYTSLEVLISYLILFQSLLLQLSCVSSFWFLVTYARFLSSVKIKHNSSRVNWERPLKI